MLDIFLMVIELMLVFNNCLVRFSQVCRVCVGLVVYESVFWVCVLWLCIVCRVVFILCGLFMVLKMWNMFMLFFIVCLMKCFIMLLVQWWQLSRFWLCSSICRGVFGMVFLSLCRWIYGFLLRKWMQVLKVVLFQYFSDLQFMLLSVVVIGSILLRCRWVVNRDWWVLCRMILVMVIVMDFFGN